MPCQKNRFQQIAFYFQEEEKKKKSVVALKIDQDYPNWITRVPGGIGKVSNLEILIKEISGKTFLRSIKGTSADKWKEFTWLWPEKALKEKPKACHYKQCKQKERHREKTGYREWRVTNWEERVTSTEGRIWNCSCVAYSFYHVIIASLFYLVIQPIYEMG